MAEMQISNRKLREFYETGKSQKYRVDTNTAKNFFAVCSILENLDTIKDGWTFAGLKLKKLKGNELWSARVTVKYRIEMKIKFVNNDPNGEIKLIDIVELSNHYSI